jgi:hypothetical protein
MKEKSFNRHCERLKGARQSMLWIASSLLLLAMTVNVTTAFAQETPDPATFEQRLELAKKMHEFRPVKEQVDKAIDAYVSNMPQEQQEDFRTALTTALNYDALEKLSVDAMTETYTLEELTAMVDYYGKPEARSASDKYDVYAGKVYPEIGKMLDKAIMRVKTGAAP